MNSATIVEISDFTRSGLILIDKHDHVWQTFDVPWWNVSALIKWVLTPGAKVWVHLKTSDGRTVRVKAVRLSRTFVKMG